MKKKNRIIIFKLKRKMKKIFELINGMLLQIFTKKYFIDCIQTIIKTAIISTVTAIFLLFSNNVFKTYKDIKHTNDIINNLCLGESKEYIEYILEYLDLNFAMKISVIHSIH